MNIPFEVSAVYVATPIIKNLFSNTDNLILAGIVAGSSGGADDIPGVFDITIPATSFWLTGFSLVTDLAAYVELGIYNGTTFVKLYPTVATAAVGGGMVRRFDSSGPLFPRTLNDIASYPALRITGAASSTIKVTGDIGVNERTA